MPSVEVPGDRPSHRHAGLSPEIRPCKKTVTDARLTPLRVIGSLPIRNHPLQTLPGGLVFRQFADRLECRFQVRNVEMIAMPADNTDGDDSEPSDDEIAYALLLGNVKANRQNVSKLLADTTPPHRDSSRTPAGIGAMPKARARLRG